MLGEIPDGEIPNNESYFPAHPTIFETKDKNPGICKVAGLKQTYYGNRGDDVPQISSCCAVQGWRPGVVGVTQLAPSSVQLSSQQFFGDVSNPAILPVLLVCCFQIVVGESWGYLRGIFLVSKGQSARISPLVPKEK